MDRGDRQLRWKEAIENGGGQVTCELHRAAELLRDGGVIAHATEGVWGLACDPNDAAAVARILEIKGREFDKGLLLIGHTATVFEVEWVGAEHRDEVLASWPGPHTWVLPNSRFTPEVTGGRETIACRVPGHAQARALCELFGGPLVSTSANRSGQPALTEEEAVRSELGAEVDMVLSGEVNNPGAASAIYALNGERLR